MTFDIRQESPASKPAITFVGICAAIAAAYTLLAAIGFIIAGGFGAISCFWPPAGLAAAAMLRLGRRHWPGVAVGSMLIALPTNGYNLLGAIAVSFGATMASIVASELYQNCGGRRDVSTIADVTRWIVCAAFVAPLVSAGVGIFALTLEGRIRIVEALQGGLVWWFGDGAGAVIVGLAVVSLSVVPMRRLKGLKWLELAMLALALAATVWFVFMDAAVYGHSRVLDKPYLVFPCVIWASMRFGRIGAAATSLVYSVAAVLALRAGVPGFFSNVGIVDVQIYLCVVTVSAYITAALTEERFEAGAAAKRTEILSRQTLASLSDGVIIWGIDGRIVAVNDAYLRIAMMGRDQVVGRSIDQPAWLLSTEDGVPLMPDEYPSAIAKRTADGVTDRVYKVAFPHRTAFVKATARRVLDDDGRMIGVVLSCRDVSMERLAKEQDPDMTPWSLLDDLNALIYVTDDVGSATYHNRKWQSFAGKDFANWNDLIHPDDRERVIESETSAFARRRSYHERYRLVRHDGVPRWFRDFGGPRYARDGTFIGFAGILVDAEAEERIKADATRSARMAVAWQLAADTVASLSPLVSVVSAGLERVGDGEGHLADAAEASRHLAKAVRRIINLANAEETERTAIHVGAEMHDIVRDLSPSIGSQWPIDVWNDADSVSLVDRTSFGAAVSSLLINAKSAMPEGGRIVVSVKELAASEVGISSSGDGGWVVIEVAESGLARDGGAVPTRPFSAVIDGELGIGPASRFAIEMGGRIELSNVTTHGTKVRLLLPRISAQGFAAAPHQGPLPAGRGESVIVVFADAPRRAGLVGEIARLGYEASGIATFQEAGAFATGLVIADPFEAWSDPKGLAWLRSGAPRRGILWLSPHPADLLEEHGRIEDGEDVLRTPFTRRDLATALRASFAGIAAKAWAGDASIDA